MKMKDDPILLPGAVRPLPLVMLSFWEPWATECLRLKPVENRPFAPARCSAPLVLVMHRSQIYDYASDKRVRALDPELGPVESMEPTGVIVGALLITEILSLGEHRAKYGPNPWAFGPKCWCRTHHWTALDVEQTPMKGRQGLTYLDAGTEIRSQVLATLPPDVRKLLSEDFDESFTRTMLETGR